MTDIVTTDMFRMPALGADMTEGRVIEWLVAEGQPVDRGDLVAVVETDKSDIEIEVFEACVFDEFLVELNELVPIGAPIARITTRREPRPRGPAPTTSVTAAPTPELAVRTADRAHRTDGAAAADTRRLTPRARRLAEQHGVDLTELGDDGPVTGEMVLQVADRGPATGPDRSQRMRRAVAALMEQSWREIPHYHVGQQLDLTDVAARLEERNAERPLAERVVLAAALNVAIARAAAATPAMNGWWKDGRFVPADEVGLGLIVSLRTGGIVAPTMVDAAQLDIDEMMRAMIDLVGRARRGRLRERDLQPASISVTNMGERGVDTVAGVIYPPQVTLVGLGAPRATAGVVGGVVAVRTTVEATVAGDHRAHDGLVAARFLHSVSDHLEALP